MNAAKLLLPIALAALAPRVSLAVTGDKAEFRKVAQDVYAFVGKRNDANALAVVTSQGVVLVDTGNNPPETRHQAGGSLGGAIVSNKLFYFGNAEVTRHPEGRVNCTSAGRSSWPASYRKRFVPSSSAKSLRYSSRGSSKSACEPNSSINIRFARATSCSASGVEGEWADMRPILRSLRRLRILCNG